ncbi:hypothetical protein N2152v2_009819 [Parachlorella kessleri]
MRITDRQPVSLEPKELPVLSKAAPPQDWPGDLLVLGVFEDCFESTDDKPSIKSEELKALDGAFDGALSEIVSLLEFKGKKGSSQVVRCGKGSAARFVGLCGLGPAEKAKPVADWGASPFQTLGACVASAAKSVKAKSAAVALVGATLEPAAAGRIANGVINGGYESTRFKTKPTPSPLERVELLLGQGAAGSSAAGEVDAAVRQGVVLARGALLTRYLVESPPNVATPSHLADAAKRIAEAAPDVMKLEVLERDECEALGMGCYLGVAEASDEPPKFIHLTYTPPGEVKRKVAVVGKGLTFDSGGYNIKAGAGSLIELMKFDMGGSGATLGAAQAVSQLKPEGVEVHFIVAACENMVDGKGLRPGDILVASNGTTVEIINTDAEGRLTLADALLFAQKQCGAEAIVDIATLTGACMVALGTGMAGMYASDEAMATALQAAAKAAGEKVWQLPLVEAAELAEELKSPIADLKNLGGRYAGSITAALFLKEFVDTDKVRGEKVWRLPLDEAVAELNKSPIADLKNSGGRMGGSIIAALFLKEFVDTDKVSWAHIDMAGPVWNEKEGGATGFGAQLLAHWVLGQATTSSGQAA